MRCLRMQARDLIGREREIETLCVALIHPSERTAGRTAGIWGVNGSGKTALALEAGRRLADGYSDTLYLNLRGSSADPLSSDEALARLFYALEPETPWCPDPAKVGMQYRSLLQDRRTLLILDDAADVEQIRPLLPPAGCAALIAARQPLDLPVNYGLTVDPLPAQNAHALLARLAPRLDVAVAPLAQMCGNLPLALRLAGLALSTHPDLAPGSYVDRLREALTRLPLVEANLDVALALESCERQAQWRVLGLLHGFDASAAAAVWEVSSETADEILHEFLERGLVEPCPKLRQPSARYQMHGLLRAYAAFTLEDKQRARDRLRIAAHYLEVLRTAATLCAREGEDLRAGLSLLDVEWDNVHDGQIWAAQALGQSRLAGQLCSAYADVGGRCWEWRASYRMRTRWLYDGLRASREWVKPQAEIRHLGRLADVYQCQGKIEQSVAHYRQALGVAVQINDRPAQSEYLGNLGLLYSEQGDNERAFGYFQHALSVARALGDRESEGNWRGNLGSAYSALGEVEQALRCHRQALAIARERGDRRSEAIWLGNLGNSHMVMGEPRKAIRAYRQALDLAREIGDRRNQASLWGNLGNACCAQGQARKALEAYESALQIARELADRGGEGIWLLNKGLVLDQQGSRDAAISCVEASLDALREAGSPEVETAEALLARWRPAPHAPGGGD